MISLARVGAFFAKWKDRLMRHLSEADRNPPSREASGSNLRCRNCGTSLDYTDVACPACGRRVTRFSLT